MYLLYSTYPRKWVLISSLKNKNKEQLLISSGPHFFGPKSYNFKSSLLISLHSFSSRIFGYSFSRSTLKIFNIVTHFLGSVSLWNRCFFSPWIHRQNKNLLCSGPDRPWEGRGELPQKLPQRLLYTENPQNFSRFARKRVTRILLLPLENPLKNTRFARDRNLRFSDFLSTSWLIAHFSGSLSKII